MVVMNLFIKEFMMANTNSKIYDKQIASILILFTVIFIIILMTNQNLFDWAFSRHQNQLSWYIRPIFLIPFCYLSYKRSLTGIWATVFLLLTSMFWFPNPDMANSRVDEFLTMEKEYLKGTWNIYKILISLLIPVTLFALSAAFWKRNLWFGISVLVIIAVLKIIWSIYFGGTAGKSIILPATIGLALCIILVYLGFRRVQKRT